MFVCRLQHLRRVRARFLQVIYMGFYLCKTSIFEFVLIETPPLRPCASHVQRLKLLCMETRATTLCGHVREA